MDESSHSSGKKQRQKPSRDKRKHQEATSEPSPTVSAANNASGPQPQRANRRQRNEASTTSAYKVASSTPPENADNKATTEKENVVIDFSNLKRETEEIAKLTKKFAKRNISSNWHRYSAPEGTEDDGDAQEEAPADFSALIKVPASKGGHLQLKDEQEWSSASNEQLGGYFTLNLKLLSQSLACIPLYEQLRLPQHLFSEEELKHFDKLASEARQVYNPEKDEDPNESIQNTLMNLLINKEADASEKTETNKNDIKANNDISILNDYGYGNNDKPMNFDSQTKIIPSDSLGNISNVLMDNEVSIEEDKSPLQVVSNEQESVLQNNNSKSLKGIDKEKIESNSLINNKISETSTNQVSKIIYQSDETKHVSEEDCESSINKANDVDKKNEKVVRTISNNPKDNHMKTTSNSTMKKVDETKSNDIGNTLILEDDDDDLDFLLSLKKTESKKLSSVPKKDSTAQQGSKMPVQSPSAQNSELDDWLDSVLQD